MPRISPTLEGFRAAWRRPSVTFAEIVWRWTVGAAAWSLFVFAFLEYLDTLPVTNGELLLLRTRHPVLVGQAISKILHGSLSRAVIAGMLAALALTFLWMIAASLGRAVTIRALLDYFRRDVTSGLSTEAPAPGVRSDSFRALLGLNFLRAALALAAILGFLGAAILAGMSSTPANPRPGLAFFLVLPMAGLVCLAWSTLNWFLSLAALFAVRDGDDTPRALSTAVAFSRERAGPVSAVSTWFGLIHLAVFIGATTVVSLPLGLAPVVPVRILLVVVFLLTLAYFAVADWLYVARLAGFVCITETPQELLSPPPVSPPASEIEPCIPRQTSIDPGESILSDLPGLA